MPRPPRTDLVDAADLVLDPISTPTTPGTPETGTNELPTALAALVHWFDSRHVRDDVRTAVRFPSTELLDFLAVNQLTLRGALRATELADALQTSRPNLSKVARRLEATGLAARTADPADDRGVLLALTPAGAEIGRRILEHGRRALLTALEGWSRQDAETFERLLVRFTAATTPAADDPVRGGFAYPHRSTPQEGPDDDVSPAANPQHPYLDRAVDRR